MQKTILEYFFKKEILAKAIAYIIITTWLVYVLAHMFLFRPSNEFFIYFSVNFSIALAHFICIHSLFKMKNSIEKYVKDLKLEEEKSEVILDNLFNIENNFDFLDKILKIFPFKKQIGRLIILGIGLTTVALFFYNSILNSSENIYDQIEVLLLLFVLVIMIIIFTDLCLIGINAVLLPKKLTIYELLAEPIPYHEDESFGYARYGDFSFRLYLLFSFVIFLYFLAAIIVNWNVNYYLLNSPDIYYLSLLYGVIGYIFINAVLIFLIISSLKYYKKLIKNAKDDELKKITSLINKLILQSDENEYWKIQNFMNLRKEIKAIRTIPINTQMMKKIMLSLIGTIATTILLPNLLILLS